MFVRGFYMYSFVVVCSFCKRGKDKLNGPCPGGGLSVCLAGGSALAAGGEPNDAHGGV